VKRLLVSLLKFGVSATIITYLVTKAVGDKTFTDLADRPKHWGILAAALMTCLVATLISFLRWKMLVRAVGIPLALRDALRLSFLGYLLNFVSPGSVGGDLFKAVFLVREHPTQRGAAIASVLTDRVMGLFSLMLLGSCAILLFGQTHAPNEVVRDICWGVLGCTAAGAAGVAVLLWPGFTQGSLARWLRNRGRLGPMFNSLLTAVQRYRSQPSVLVIGTLASLGVHVCSTLSIYLVARGIPGHVPSLADHFIIAPLSMLAAAMPFAFGGLGAFEGSFDLLYIYVPIGEQFKGSEGLIVALGFRVITILIALIGAGYYLTGRREVRRVWSEAQQNDVDPAGEQLLISSAEGA
jgi:uncharacterized membrane protein YbhN (UPF0104 family)